MLKYLDLLLNVVVLRAVHTPRGGLLMNAQLRERQGERE